jgi:hypothetical protein
MAIVIVFIFEGTLKILFRRGLIILGYASAVRAMYNLELCTVFVDLLFNKRDPLSPLPDLVVRKAPSAGNIIVAIGTFCTYIVLAIGRGYQKLGG